MGVTGLWSILDSVGHPIKLDALEGRRLGVDANLWLYKFIRGFRDKDNATNLDSHKLGLFNRISKLLFYKIKPIFVFDGPAPVLKRRTLEKRRDIRGNTKKHSDVAVRLFKEQLKKQYPNLQNIDELDVNLPNLTSDNLVAAEKMTDEDRAMFYTSEKEINFDECRDKTILIDTSDESEEEESDYQPFIKRSKEENINLDSDDFANLPADIRYEYLKGVKEESRRIKRHEQLPEDPNDFSKLQLDRLIKRRSIQEKLEKCESDIRGIFGEAVGRLKEYDHVNVQYFPVQSDPTRHMIYRKGSSQGISSQNDQSQSASSSSQGDVKKQTPNVQIIEKSEVNVSNLATDKYLSVTTNSPEQLRTEESPEKTITIETSDESEDDEDSFQEVPIPDRYPLCRDNTILIDTSDESEEEESDYSKGSTQGNSSKNEQSRSSSSSATKLITSPLVETENYTQQQSTQHNKTEAEKEKEDKSKMINRHSSEDCIDDQANRPNYSDKDASSFLSNHSIKQSAKSYQKSYSQSDVDQSQRALINGTKPINRMEYSSNEEPFELDEVASTSHSLDGFNNVPKPILSPPNLELPSPQRSLSPSLDNSYSTEQVVMDPMPLSTSTPPPAEIDRHRTSALLDSQQQLPQQLSQQQRILQQAANDNLQTQQQQQQPDYMNEEKKHERYQETIRPTIDEFRSSSSSILNEINKADRQTNKVTTKIIEEAQELLRLFGVPYIVAAGEAEAQCAILETLGHTEGTITDDSDIWLFGAKKVYRHFFSDDKYVLEYKMSEIEHHLRMDRENLICFAMLVGSDYTDGVMNVGPVTALEILSEFQAEGLEPLRKFRQWRDEIDRLTKQDQKKMLKEGVNVGNSKRKTFLKFKLPQEFPSHIVFEGYQQPLADTSEDKFSWRTPELDELREYARRQFDWDQKRIDDKLLPVMKRLAEKKIQPTIDSYFFKTAVEENPELFRSKRVNQALSKIGKSGPVPAAKRTKRGDKAG